MVTSLADHETEGFHVSDKGHPVTLQEYYLTSNFAKPRTKPGKQKAKAWNALKESSDDEKRNHARTARRTAGEAKGDARSERCRECR
jgi:hypothetical protein